MIHIVRNILNLLDGTLTTLYVSNNNPTLTTNGIQIYQCSVTNENGEQKYSDNQLIVRSDLRLLYQQLQSVTVGANPTTISCCGGSSTLSTTAYFKLVTVTEDDTTTATAQTSAIITASYSDDKSYTTINGNTITFTKNEIDYPTSTSAASRNSVVTGSYTYSGSTKTNTVTITQSANYVDANWTNTTTTTTSIAVDPSLIEFAQSGETKSYSVIRYYTQYQEKYDSCDVLMDNNSYETSMTVTPSEATCSGDFTCTVNDVTISANEEYGDTRDGILTVKYDGFEAFADLTQEGNSITVLIPAFDYLVITYTWASSDGDDLDTVTVVPYLIKSNGSTTSDTTKYPYVGDAVGFGQGYSVTGSDKNGNSITYMEHAGDNTDDGDESVYFNFKTMSDEVSIREMFMDGVRKIRLDLYGTWFSSKGEGNVNVNITAYSGGTMVDSGYTFVNSGGSIVYKDTQPAKVCVQGGGSSSYETNYTHIGYVEYNITDKTAKLSLDPSCDGSTCTENYHYGNTSLEVSMYEMDACETDITIESVTLNGVVHVKTNCGTETLSYDIPEGSYTYTISPQSQNTGTTLSREVDVTFTLNSTYGGGTYTTTVTQYGKDNCHVYELINKTENTSFSNVNGTDATVNVYFQSLKNNVNFDQITLSESCDWVTSSDIKTSGDTYYFIITANANTGTTERQCDIKLTQAESGYELSYTLTQYAPSCEPTTSYSYTNYSVSYPTEVNCDEVGSPNNITVEKIKTIVNEFCQVTTSSTNITLSESDYTVIYDPIGNNTGTTNRTISATVTHNGSEIGTYEYTQNSGSTCQPTIYTYTFKNCYSDKQIALFASNTTPSGSHTQYVMLNAIDGTSVSNTVSSTNGMVVNGGTAYIGDNVKLYSVTNSSSWTLEETITLTAKDRSFEYGDCTSSETYTCYLTIPATTNLLTLTSAGTSQTVYLLSSYKTTNSGNRTNLIPTVSNVPDWLNVTVGSYDSTKALYPITASATTNSGEEREAIITFIQNDTDCDKTVNFKIYQSSGGTSSETTYGFTIKWTNSTSQSSKTILATLQQTGTTGSETKTLTLVGSSGSVTVEGTNRQSFVMSSVTDTSLSNSYNFSGDTSYSCTTAYTEYYVTFYDKETSTSCTCSVTSISVSPSTYTFTSSTESKTFTVTISDNNCSECNRGFKVYNLSGSYVTSGTSTFSLSNQSGTFTIKANDDTSKTCTLTLTKYTQTCSTDYNYDNATLSFSASMAACDTEPTVSNVKITNVLYTSSDCSQSYITENPSSSNYTVSSTYNSKNTGSSRNVSVTVTTDSLYGGMTKTNTITQPGGCTEGVCTASTSYTYSNYSVTYTGGSVACNSTATPTVTATRTAHMTSSTCNETTSSATVTISSFDVSYNPSGNNTTKSNRTVTGTVTHNGTNAGTFTYTQNSGSTCYTPSTSTTTEYDIQVLDVSIEKCATSASPTVQGRSRTNVLSDGVVTSSGTWSSWSNLSSSYYSLSYSSSLEKNETSSVKTYTVTVTGKSTYANLTDTATVTQAAGPCTEVKYEYMLEIDSCEDMAACDTSVPCSAITVSAYKRVVGSNDWGDSIDVTCGTDYTISADTTTQNTSGTGNSYREVMIKAVGKGTYSGVNSEEFSINQYDGCGYVETTYSCFLSPRNNNTDWEFGWNGYEWVCGVGDYLKSYYTTNKDTTMVGTKPYVYSKPSWATVTIDDATDTYYYKINVSVDDNTTGSERTGTVEFRQSGNCSEIHQIFLTQTNRFSCSGVSGNYNVSVSGNYSGSGSGNITISSSDTSCIISDSVNITYIGNSDHTDPFTVEISFNSISCEITSYSVGGDVTYEENSGGVGSLGMRLTLTPTIALPFSATISGGFTYLNCGNTQRGTFNFTFTGQG